jgi:transposase
MQQPKVVKREKKRNKKNRASSSVDSASLSSVQPKVAGIDLGSREHWVCGPALTAGEPNVRVFGTTTPRLQELAEWLLEQGVESVAMESTHVYWIPIYELLESHGIEVVLVNARQLHNVPGRKTDMQDCQWLQLLHSCGLLRGSFRPHESITRMRALQRQLANLVGERTRFVQWMQQALDQMNIQVHRAVTDITGQTGMAIVRAVVAGERDPLRLAALRHGRCQKSGPEFVECLMGNWREEHLFNLEAALALYDAVEQRIATYEARLLQELTALQPSERLDQSVPAHLNPAKEKAIRSRGEQPARTTLWRFAGVDLTRIDGISTGAAQVILTEVGMDLSSFPSENHFVSWLRLSPRTAISGGKPLHKKKPNGTGATRIAGVLRMAAVSLQRSKSALGAAFRRKARHKGGAVAVFATARRLAILVYRMLRYGQDYTDIGEQQYEAQFTARRLANLKDTAKCLGFDLVPRVATG